MLTERDIFFSTHPRTLLLPHSRDQLEAAFGPSDRSEDLSDYIDELIEDIYRKYNRIDLVTWDPQPNEAKTAFFDFVSQKPVSLDQVNKFFDKYSPMALQRLQGQLELALNRWGSSNSFGQLYNRINNRIQKILTTGAIIEQ